MFSKEDTHMKYTSWIWRLAVLMTALLLILSVTACNPKEVAKENAEVREMAVLMLDSVMHDDYDTARELMKDSVSDEDFRRFYDGARKLFEGVESYTLTMIGLEYNVSDGVTRYTAVYRLETNVGKDYDVTVGTSSDTEGLFGFHLTSAGSDKAEYTGTLTTLKQATPEQWVMILIGFATVVFVIAMLVDCCRQKILKKWLWILVIIFGSVAFLVTLQEGGVKLNFNFFNLLSYTALLIYQSPANVVQLRLFLPVGAIVYLIHRKALLAEGKLWAEKKEETASVPSSEPEKIRMEDENEVCGKDEKHDGE